MKNFLKKSGLVAVISTAVASPAFADIAADIAAAQASGENNVTLAVTAVIGIAAVVLGVGIVLRLLGR